MYYLKCKKISTAIRRAKKELVAKVKKHGLYENFGQKEIRNIEDKFIKVYQQGEDIKDQHRQLKSFRRWCENFNDKDLEEVRNG